MPLRMTQRRGEGATQPAGEPVHLSGERKEKYILHFKPIHFAILTKTFCNFDKYICSAVYDTQSRGQQKLFICQRWSGRGGGSRGEEVEAPLIQITFITTLPHNCATFLHCAFSKIEIKFIITLLREPHNGLHYI